MAFVKITYDKYMYYADMVNTIRYIADSYKSPNLIWGGRNIIGNVYHNPYDIAEQFSAVQWMRPFRRRIYHVIISFDPVLDNPDKRLLTRVGNSVIAMYPKYQSVFTAHENTRYLHLHIVFNNVSVLWKEKNLSYSINRYNIQNTVDYMIDRHIGLTRESLLL